MRSELANAGYEVVASPPGELAIESEQVKWA